jgi:hypothetical protein
VSKHSLYKLLFKIVIRHELSDLSLPNLILLHCLLQILFKLGILLRVMPEKETLSRFDNSTNPFAELSKIYLCLLLGVPHFDKNLDEVKIKLDCPSGAPN